MKAYFNVDVYVDDKNIYESKPFTSAKELLEICEDIAKVLDGVADYKWYEVHFFYNGKYDALRMNEKKENHYHNFCELVTAIYYHLDFDVYAEE